MSPFAPWGQQAALAPGAPQEAPPREPLNWWEKLGQNLWPWQQPSPTQPTGRAEGRWTPFSRTGYPYLSAPDVQARWGTVQLTPRTEAIMGTERYQQAEARRQAQEQRLPGWLTPEAPPTAPPTTPAPVLPQPGEDLGEAAVPDQPQVIEAGGQQFWWNPTGGMYGTGGWDLVPTPTPRGQTPEDRAHQLAMLQEQYRLEQQAMGQQAGAQRGQQEAAAAQQMAQMYAADPYKYWAQMGQGTPGAVARLTGGEIGAGEQFQPGVPLSTPSAQWWQNLLPSEQQQISGGLNWMGVDPQDWYSMYQRMIPGLGQRQMAPQWAR